METSRQFFLDANSTVVVVFDFFVKGYDSLACAVRSHTHIHTYIHTHTHTRTHTHTFALSGCVTKIPVNAKSFLGCSRHTACRNHHTPLSETPSSFLLYSIATERCAEFSSVSLLRQQRFAWQALHSVGDTRSRGDE